MVTGEDFNVGGMLLAAHKSGVSGAALTGVFTGAGMLANQMNTMRLGRALQVARVNNPYLFVGTTGLAGGTVNVGRQALDNYFTTGSRSGYL
jgi:hypothetical protein